MDQITNGIVTLVERTKKVVTISLMISMLLIVIASTVELGIIIYKEAFDAKSGEVFLDIEELFGLFGFFFLILIGIELLETIEMYVKNNVIHVEIVLMVAIIAMSRKVILLDQKIHEPLELVG